MIGLKSIIAVTALALTVGVGGCTPKEAPKVVKTEKVLAAKPLSTVTVEALDKRVSVLERKARGYDSRIKEYDKAKGGAQ